MVSLLLVEHTEAFFGLVFTSAVFRPSLVDYVLAERQVETIPLLKVWVTLLELILNFFGGQFVKSEILNYVHEVVRFNIACLFVLIVELERFFQVLEHVARESVHGLLGRLNSRAVKLLLF